METHSALLILQLSPVDSLHQAIWRFDVLFVVNLNKLLKKRVKIPVIWNAIMIMWSHFIDASDHFDGLTHWGRVTHICVAELTIIVSDNGLSPGRRQAIIWTNAGMLLIGPHRTNFSEILIEILTFSFMKMSLKVSSGKWRPFCLGLNVLRKT